MGRRLEVVFATTTASVPMSGGGSVVVRLGEHRLVDDPVVTEHPAMFADDPRYGLTWYGDPPPEMAIPPDQPLGDDEGDSGTRGRRARPKEAANG